MNNNNPCRLSTRQLVERWRSQRRRLLWRLQAAPLQPARPEAQALHARILDLCQTLVDYLAAGHFVVYARLLEEVGNTTGGWKLELLRGIYRRIESSTDYALSFNDKYDTDVMSLCSERSLPADLALLQRVLLIRFELEDHLIDVLQGVAAESAVEEAPL